MKFLVLPAVTGTMLTAAKVGVVSATPSHYHSCTANFSGGSRLPYPFCNASIDTETRLDNLLSLMTLFEKAMSLDTSNPAIPRLGVPSMQSGESTHGIATGCGSPGSDQSTGCPTSFPSGTGLGATFDKDLWKEVGAVIGTEARGLNNQGVAGLYFLDPNINLMRDPRWGRAQEVPGEDPTLTAEYATAIVNATQRGNGSNADTGGYLLAASTIKHYSMQVSSGGATLTHPEFLSVERVLQLLIAHDDDRVRNTRCFIFTQLIPNACMRRRGMDGSGMTWKVTFHGRILVPLLEALTTVTRPAVVSDGTLT